MLKSLTQFLARFPYLLFVEYYEFFNALDNNNLSDISSEDIFSQSETCLFLFLTVSFGKQILFF